MKLLGLISDGRAHKSKSPAMHNLILGRKRIEGIYLPLAVAPARVGQAVAGLRGLGFSGANVTVPYKEKVMAHLDGLSDEARAIGAVNTIVCRGNSLVGHNTDALGFSAALTENIPIPQHGRGLVVGTGGAAKAVVHALAALGLEEIILCGRTRPGAGRFGAASRWMPLPQLGESPLEADLVVNATSVSAPEEAPELAELLRRTVLSGCGLVFDLNYGRTSNFWADLAGRSGAEFADGLTMLAHQAAESFRLWTGLKVAATEFRAALEDGR